MSKFIPAETMFTRWKSNPKFAAAYEAMEEEFALAASAIKERISAETKLRGKVCKAAR